MGPVNWLAVFLGAAAFFAVGAVWYSVLFSKAWQAEVRFPEGHAHKLSMPVMLVLTYLCELVVSAMFGHMLARTQPSPHVIWMMAFGFGATIMVPAMAINYLYQAKSLKLFLIDAGHLLVGAMAMGAVFIALG